MGWGGVGWDCGEERDGERSEVEYNSFNSQKASAITYSRFLPPLPFFSKAHDGRDEALVKQTALRERADKELAQYNIDIKELTRVLEHDRKLKGFMAIKGQERKVGWRTGWCMIHGVERLYGRREAL